MKSLREFSSAVMQKHLLRAKLRQLVNKARVYGRTPDNVGEIKKGWGQYDAMKARAFAAQVFALRELASRSERVVELGDFDPSRLPPEFVAKIQRMREAKLKDPNYANVNGYIVKASNRAAVEDIVKKGGRPNIRDGNVVAAYFPGQQKKEFALVRDANGQLVEDNGGSGLKTAAKVGLGAAGAAGAAVVGTRGYHYYNAVKAAGKGSFRKGIDNAATVNSIMGDGHAEKLIGARAQTTARQGWMGKLGKVGNVLTKF